MQLTRLVRALELQGEPLWVTFDTPQSRSLLEGAEVRFVRHTGPRDAWSVLRNLPAALRILRSADVVEVVSTGSAIALSFLPLARILGVRAHYIESAARSQGPSITGAMLSRVPGLRVYTQYPAWAGGRWNVLTSVFDGYAPVSVPAPEGALKVVVALGTLAFRFDRLVDAVLAAVPPGAEIVWQVGPNDYPSVQGDVTNLMPASDFASACAAADVVVAHSGVGTALTAIESGRVPILIPRRSEMGEHVDDHQLLIGEELERRGLAILASPSELTAEVLLAASSLSTRRKESDRRVPLR